MTSGMGKRKGAWSFSAVWTFSGHMVATTSTDPTSIQRELLQLDTELTRLVKERERFPPFLRNVELKYKLSDWELARTKKPIHLPVQGYIQSQSKHATDFDNLKLWFDATWSPVENGLRRNQAYLAWSEDDPAYRHVQVSGEPAVDKGGRHKKDKQVRLALEFSTPVTTLTRPVQILSSLFCLSPISIGF